MTRLCNTGLNIGITNRLKYRENLGRTERCGDITKVSQKDTSDYVKTMIGHLQDIDYITVTTSVVTMTRDIENLCERSHTMVTS